MELFLKLFFIIKSDFCFLNSTGSWSFLNFSTIFELILDLFFSLLFISFFLASTKIKISFFLFILFSINNGISKITTFLFLFFLIKLFMLDRTSGWTILMIFLRLCWSAIIALEISIFFTGKETIYPGSVFFNLL